jgi:hypothetical protein
MKDGIFDSEASVANDDDGDGENRFNTEAIVDKFRVTEK